MVNCNLQNEYIKWVVELLEQDVKESGKNVNGEEKCDEKVLEVIPKESTKKKARRKKQMTFLTKIIKIIIILKLPMMIIMKKKLRV